ncbi:hypothetical protein MPER_04334 [Moniliophthora perniciosa FA553]|nr:hypothetical protein MPER_04334 [Moniliophthora perniciosa FA553]
MYHVGERLGINMFAAPLASDLEQILRRRTRRQERDERAARRASRGGVQKREILPRSQRPDPNEVIDLTASAFIDLTRDDTELTGSTNDECPAVRDASTVDFTSTGNEDPSANKSKVASVEDEREYVTESSDAASTEVAAYRAYTRPEPGSSRPYPRMSLGSSDP